MASPSKRRKKNDGSSSARPVRNLDFFFGTKHGGKAENLKPDSGLNGNNTPQTDEEYARQLHEQWNKEDSAGKEKDTGEGSTKGEELVIFEGGVSTEFPDGGAGDTKIHSPFTELTARSKKTPLSSPMAPRPPIVLEDSVAIETAIASLPLDKDPLLYDPDSYQSITAEFSNGKAPYSLLTRAFILVNSTRSRIKIVDTLVNLLRTLIRLDPQSLLPAVSLLLYSTSSALWNVADMRPNKGMASDKLDRPLVRSK